MGPQQPNNIQAPPTANEDPNKALAVISLIFPLFGLSLIGLIFALLALRQSKQAGYRSTLAKVSLWINGIFLILTALLFTFFFVQNFLFVQLDPSNNRKGEETPTKPSYTLDDKTLGKLEEYDLSLGSKLANRNIQPPPLQDRSLMGANGTYVINKQNESAVINNPLYNKAKVGDKIYCYYTQAIYDKQMAQDYKGEYYTPYFAIYRPSIDKVIATGEITSQKNDLIRNNIDFPISGNSHFDPNVLKE